MRGEHLKTFLLLMAGLVALGLLTAGMQERRASGAATEHSAGQVDRDSIEYRMAYIDRGGNVADNDPLIDEFRNRIGSIASRTGYSPERIADLTTYGWKDLQDRGIRMRLIEFTREAHEASKTNVDIKYDAVIAMLIRYMEKAGDP